MSIALGPYLSISSSAGSPSGLVLKHWCPACEGYHRIHVEKPNHINAVWSWNQNIVCPSFVPLINISATDPDDGELRYRCHYSITDGNLIYCSDCTHALSGKTVQLPRMPIFPEDVEYWYDLDFGS